MSGQKEYLKRIPKEILDNYVVKKVLFSKVGNVGLSPKKDVSEESHDFISEFIECLYEAINRSDSVLELKPNKQELLTDPVLTVSPVRNTVGITKFLKMRVALPVRKRKDLFDWPGARTPESFQLFFNGFEFFCISEIEQGPWNGLGQLAREFLKDVLNNHNLWSVETVGPSPIHYDIYFVLVDGMDIENNDGYKVIVDGKNMFIVLPERLNFDAFLDLFMRDSEDVLEKFYMASSLSQAVYQMYVNLEESSAELSEKIEIFINYGFLKRAFSNTSKDIRKGIAGIHLLLQKINNNELLLEKMKVDIKRALDKSYFYYSVKNYFVDEVDLLEKQDKKSVLSMMTFASEQINNIGIMQATVMSAISGLVGAVVGGIIALVAKP